MRTLLRRGLLAGATLAVLAGASWLPAAVAVPAAADGSLLPPSLADLARPALPAPAAWSTRPGSAEAATAAFLWSLSAAVAHNPPAPTPSATGTAPAARFAQAYTYLDPEWRRRTPFAAFLAPWAPVRRLEPLAILAAGPVRGGGGAASVFVEARLLVTPPEMPGRSFVQFVAGFYVAAPSPDGWRLQSGALQPERFGARADDEREAETTAAAAAAALARNLGRPVGPVTVRLRRQAGYRAEARVTLADDAYDVALYQCVDRQWIALSVTR